MRLTVGGSLPAVCNKDMSHLIVEKTTAEASQQEEKKTNNTQCTHTKNLQSVPSPDLGESKIKLPVLYTRAHVKCAFQVNAFFVWCVYKNADSSFPT